MRRRRSSKPTLPDADAYSEVGAVQTSVVNAVGCRHQCRNKEHWEGHIVVATFGPEGPKRCSGLDVIRYTPDGLHAAFGGEFRKVASETEVHTTPWGSEQQFVYCYCRLR
jgi:hypothetical protein